MLLRPFALLALSAALLVPTGCSGGSAAAGSANFSCSNGASQALCLHSCSLGCSSTGCLLTDIAQNEIILLYFNRDIDPASVNSSTIRLRTAQGAEPVGEFFVVGSRVEFVPTLLISGGQTFFGFRPNETYTLTIPGGEDEPETLRSTSGFKFAEDFTCTLVANQGIRDLNGVGPSAQLISPTANQLASTPLDAIIQLEFNEMIDVTPFQSSNPVTFEVRRTRTGQGGARECDSNSAPQPLPGTTSVDFDPARGISVVTFRPQSNLPPNVCIEVNVTSAVVDLAGKPAQPQTFTFLTEEVALQEFEVVEEFDTSALLDRDVSGGSWGGGVATFASIGGDARHGSFSTSLGTDLGMIAGKHTFEINTDSTTIPAENTLTGSPMAVTDGRFYFSDFVLEATDRLRFVGSNPPIITVAGKIDIRGEIDISAPDVPYPPVTTASVGQAGGQGGIFAGAGGQGGNKCLGTGALPAYQGKDGEDANVLAGHGYLASTVGTGGKGSTLFPADGLSSSLYYVSGQTIAYTPSASAGGGGGSLATAGLQGRVTNNNHPDPGTGVPPRLDVMGPPAAAGSLMPFLPFPPPSGSSRSSLHFLVGGAGGGGAASNAALAIAISGNPISDPWRIGAGGGGGGGAMALRAGDSLILDTAAALLAEGGSTGSVTSSAGTASPMPGGAGSGGTFVLQSGRTVDLQGLVSVLGGAGGTYNRSAGGTAAQGGASVQVAGGDGGAGFVRVELPGSPTTSVLPNAQPAAAADNVGTLVETDDLVSFRSKWYTTGLVFGPEYARYEIYATVDGVPVVFSDDPAVGSQQAGTGAALRLWIQSGQIDNNTGAVLETRPWRNSVVTTAQQIGIASDALNGFRFALVLDRTIAQVVTIDKFVVVYRS